METQNPNPGTSPSSDSPSPEFTVGESVIYSLHGKCAITGIEARQLNADQPSVRFYRLEVQKSTLSRSSRHDPAIWVPVATAIERGMRPPMSVVEAEEAMKILANREYYFSLSTPWSTVQPLLESTIRKEGGIGLAKVASYMIVLRKKQLVPSSAIVRFQESVMKLLLRELSEALNVLPKALEERIAKISRQKLLPDN